ncbi:D-2-hydroxyacid dehydrogenase [Brevibacillus fluminis]|uniref:D-2-hydroxyacid dehydrogenase n=1 Tax=Brevibacillus fluminis TaxID=511487 RepID=A0A3M8D197_9BACL|nr:D-isomer specific 2-hydroxyacid dehydrogenase family protein [Brevibacillus fluminis]RNB81187.1 D-2-hydroxyacid dehydrogenase [Brevibacillus fluminis]
MLIVLPNADDLCEKLLTDYHKEQLSQFGKFELYRGRPNSTQEYVDRVRDANVLLLWGSISNEVLGECHNVSMVSFAGTGYKNYLDADFAASRGIKVTNTPSYGANPVAEHAVALMMSLAKNIPSNHSLVSAGHWGTPRLSFELEGKVVGLIGLGAIGTRMAALCSALGMKVLCWTAHPSEERAKKAGVTFVSLESLLSQSDVVSIHLPYTDATKGVIGEEQFASMKRGAIFINTARAEVVDTSSLVRSLQSGRLAGAGIDVFDDEPIHSDNPLLRCENVIFSPHVGYNTQESIQQILDISIQNIVAFLRGNPINLVN